MSQDYKVVSIASVVAGRRQAGTERPVPLPVPLAAVRDRALTFLRVGLGELFDNVDDTLFEKADRAGNNTDQSLFFQAMRLLRLKRHAIEKACCEGLEHEFVTLQNGPPTAPQQTVCFELESLSLVQPDDLEQTVALDAMVGRVNARNQISLSHLALRLGTLVGGTVDEADNPLVPACLVQLFADSCASLNLDIKVRLIIFKMFERYVLHSIDSLYIDANGLLKNAGILPDLKANLAPVRSRSPAAANRQAQDTALGMLAGGGPQILSIFSELISSWRQASGDVTFSALDTPSAQPVPSDELLDMLSGFVAAQGVRQDTTLKDLRRRLNWQLDEQFRQTGEIRRLVRVDDDVISLVAMLFDVILDDARLPTALKALIARLQLPILRVAIADKSVFNRSSHPARRLLNELARATMGWSNHDDLRRDQLHTLLERMVERVLGEPVADAVFFEQIYEELVDFVRIEQRRAERLEQRIRDAEEGRARVDAARSKSAQVLNTLLLGRSLPALAVDLLRETWNQVLQMTCLREGRSSAAWRDAVTVAEQLVRSVERPRQEAMDQRLVMNDSVCRSFCDGLRLIGEEDPERSPKIAQLRHLQQAALQGASTAPQSYADTVTPLSRAADDGIPLLSEIILIDTPIISYEADGGAEQSRNLPGADALSWVDGLNAGGWFELSGVGDQPMQRCKLAAMISFSGKFIFVNRAGLKVAEFTRADLAGHYQQGQVRLLADDPLFDRALESVIGALRQQRASSD